MAGQVAHADWNDAGDLAQHLHKLVTNGPRDLDIASEMSRHGFDEVKWAEGQGMLAELVSCDAPTGNKLDAAAAWYDEAAITARHALATHPRLLAKLGLTGTDST